MYTFPYVDKLQKFVTSVKAHMPTNSNPKQFTHFTKEELATRSLHFYLQPYKDMLLNIEYTQVNSIIRDIMHIFAMLFKPAVKNCTENIKELPSKVSTLHKINFYLTK